MDPMIEAVNISSSSFFNPKVIEERMGPYNFRVIREQVVKPKPRDILRFHVTVTVRQFANYFSRLRIMRTPTLLETSIPINFESLLEDNQDFLQSSLFSNPQCSRYFIPEILDQISQKIVSLVQRLLEVQILPSDPGSADLECQEFPLTLGIFVDVMQEEEESEEDEDMMEDEAIEESMQQGVTMIPASNEAIHSLKTFTDSLILKTEECNICMDKFHAEEGDEDAKLSSSSMPCGHVFHHQCILKWLKTSHTCPLCRYPMPTAKD